MKLSRLHWYMRHLCMCAVVLRDEIIYSNKDNDPVYMSQKLRIFISIFLLSSLNTLIFLT